MREDDIDRQGKEEAPREIHEETALLQGELSAITFQVGRYLVRDARRVYNKNETGILWHLFDETPASDADVELVRNHSDELLHLLPSLEEPSQSDWRKRLRVVEEISARRLDDPGSSYTTICWADTSQLYHSPSPSWTEIGPIYAMKEDESDPDESASLLVCRTYCGDSSTTDTWHRLDPSGEVTCFSVDTIPSWMGL